MTTGRINQVTDRRSLCHGRKMPGLGTLHRAHRSRLWSRRRPSGPTREGHCPTGLQTSIPHRRQGTTNDFSLERNTQERHARRIIYGERLPFPASTARIPSTETVIASVLPATNPFLRPVSPSGRRHWHPCGRSQGVHLRGCTTPTVGKRGPAKGSPREPGRSVQFSTPPPRDHGQAPVAHSLGKLSPGKHHWN